MRHARFGRSVLLASGLLLAACGSAGAEKASLPSRDEGGPSVGVRVIRPSTELDGNLVKVTGRLLAKNDATLSAKASGVVAQVLVEVGDKVKKGQALLRLDSATARIQVEQAKAAQAVAQAGYDNAKQELDRARQLQASGGVSKAGLDRAEAGYKQAEAGLAQATAAVRAAQRHLADHTLIAPFDGVITFKRVNVGEYVTMMPPTAAFGLVDTSSLEVVLPVPETVVGTLAEGAVVEAVVNPSGKPFRAKVTTVGEVVDPQGRTVEVRAIPEGERIPEMRPNSMIEASFGGAEKAAGLFLPSQAVVRNGDERFVWVVQEGKLSRRNVVVQPVMPGVYQILEGIDAEVQVVSDATVGLRDGMAVRVTGA